MYSEKETGLPGLSIFSSEVLIDCKWKPAYIYNYT